MALLDLYIQIGGDDRNAGTDNGANPTEIVGSVSTTTGLTTFTTSSGTPFASGVSAGSWVSLYNQGETVSRFTGQVQSVTSSTVIVIYNQAATSPNNTALGTVANLTGTVCCRVGGAWASFAITGTNGVMNSPSTSAALTQYNGLRVNIKAGSYIFGSAITLPAGLAAKPLWWRGYYATIGDLDNLASVKGTIINGPIGASRPQISFTNTTGDGIQAGQSNWFENLELTCTSSGSTLNFTNSTATSQGRIHRCRIVTTGGIAVSAGGSIQINASYIKGSNTANYAIVSSSVTGNILTITGCTLDGTAMNSRSLVYAGASGQYASVVMIGNIIFGNQNTGVIQWRTYGVAYVMNNSVYNCGYFVSTASSVTTNVIGINNVVSNCASVFASSSVTSWFMQFINNDYFSISGGISTLMFEGLQRGAISDTTAPVPNAPGDFTLANGSLARQTGFPGQFEV